MILLTFAGRHPEGITTVFQLTLPGFPFLKVWPIIFSSDSLILIYA